VGVVSLSSLIVLFGLDTVIIRDVARDRSRAATYATNIGALRLILLCIWGAFLLVLVYSSPYDQQVRAFIAIYAAAYAFDALSEIPRSIFHGFQRMEFSTGLDLMRDMVNIVISIVGIGLGWPLVAIVAVSAFASLLKLAVSILLLSWQFTRPRLPVRLALCRNLLVGAIPFFLLTAIGVAYEKLGVVFLSWLDTAESVGIYSAATIITTALLLVPGAFYQSIFPVFSQYHQNSPEALKASYRISYKVMLLVGFPMGAGVILVAQPVIALVYGPGFEEAVGVLRILAVQLFTIVGYVNGAFLLATNRQNIFTALRGATVLLNVALLLILIPMYGYVGAAIAVAVPALVDFGLYSALCHRYLRLPFPWTATVKVVVSTLLMSGAVALLLKEGANLILVILVGSLAYTLALIVVRAIGLDEWHGIVDMLYPKRLRRVLAGR
jgi:O-antigen/teichoic acid export membrane protein